MGGGGCVSDNVVERRERGEERERISPNSDSFVEMCRVNIELHYHEIHLSVNYKYESILTFKLV